MRRKAAEQAARQSAGKGVPTAGFHPTGRCSQTWAMLIKRVYEIDPLACPQCGGTDEGDRLHRAAARGGDREDSASLRPLASLIAAAAAGWGLPSLRLSTLGLSPRTTPTALRRAAGT